MIKIYNFYFNKIKEAVKVQATSLVEARTHLRLTAFNLDQKYLGHNIVGETVFRPLCGVTYTYIDGVKHFWVGDEHPTGWLPESEVDRKKSLLVMKDC